MYSIGKVSEMFGIPVSTLRYYDKEGLFPDMERSSGIRRFSERELEALRVIECLKSSGLSIKEIRQFMDMVVEGPASYSRRRALFEGRRAALEAEMAEMERVLAMLKFKCWYYETAEREGTEEGIEALLPDSLPPEIQEFYDRAHNKPKEE